MSEPIWLGPRPPTRGEWREMQESIGASPSVYYALEARVEGMVADLVKRPFAISFGSTGDAIEAALDALGATRGSEIIIPALGPASLGAVALASATPMSTRSHSRCAHKARRPTSIPPPAPSSESPLTANPPDSKNSPRSPLAMNFLCLRSSAAVWAEPLDAIRLAASAASPSSPSAPTSQRSVQAERSA